MENTNGKRNAWRWAELVVLVILRGLFGRQVARIREELEVCGFAGRTQSAVGKAISALCPRGAPGKLVQKSRHLLKELGVGVKDLPLTVETRRIRELVAKLPDRAIQRLAGLAVVPAMVELKKRRLQRRVETDRHTTRWPWDKLVKTLVLADHPGLNWGRGGGAVQWVADKLAQLGHPGLSAGAVGVVVRVLLRPESKGPGVEATRARYEKTLGLEAGTLPLVEDSDWTPVFKLVAKLPVETQVMLDGWGCPLIVISGPFKKTTPATAEPVAAPPRVARRVKIDASPEASERYRVKVEGTTLPKVPAELAAKVHQLLAELDQVAEVRLATVVVDGSGGSGPTRRVAIHLDEDGRVFSEVVAP